MHNFYIWSFRLYYWFQYYWFVCECVACARACVGVGVAVSHLLLLCISVLFSTPGILPEKTSAHWCTKATNAHRNRFSHLNMCVCACVCICECVAHTTTTIRHLHNSIQTQDIVILSGSSSIVRSFVRSLCTCVCGVARTAFCVVSRAFTITNVNHRPCVYISSPPFAIGHFNSNSSTNL